MTSALSTMIPLADQAAWDDALRGVPHAFAHTWRSCHAMHLTTGRATFLYVRDGPDGRDVCALSERRRGNFVDVVTPYGLGGFASAAAGAGLVEDWERIARARGYVSGYIALNPLLAPLELTRRTDYLDHHRVHTLALGEGIDALRRSLSDNRRRELALATRDGLRVVDDRSRVRAYFLEHVDPFLRSRGAGAAYAFTGPTWESLADGTDVLLLGAERADGELVAAAMVAHTAYCADYLFGIRSTSGAGAMTPLLWAAAAHYIDLDVPWLNLGGGTIPGDGIDVYKSRFGGTEMAFGALRQVYRPEVYDVLSAAAGVPSTRQGSYFPPYHAPSGVLPSD